MPLPALGVRLPNSGPFATVRNILDAAVRADALGFDTVWVHDHISWPQKMLSHFAMGSIEACRDQDPDFYESLTTVAFLGGLLPRIRIGIAGLVVPLRDPRVLAKQAANIERMTGSRLTLAVAIGNVTSDFDALAQPYKRRGRITNEYLEVLRACFGEQPSSFRGETVTYEDATFLPRPLSLPIWVTGSSPAGLDRAARYGDGWMTAYQSVDQFKAMSAQLTDLTEGLGRDSSTLARAYETYVCVGETHAAAMRTCKASLEHVYGSVERGLDVCLIGSLAEVGDRIAEYERAGVTHLELKFICQSSAEMLEQMEMFAQLPPR